MKKEELIYIGVITGTFGNKGELKMKLLSDSPEFLEEVPQVIIELEDEIVPIEIEKQRFHKGQLILKIKNCNSINDGLRFKGGYVSIKKSDRPPPLPGEFYIDQLIGLDVETTDGRKLGKLEDILFFSGNEIYQVLDPSTKKEYLIPVVEDFVKEIDIENGKIIIIPIQGLLDDES
ncbi:16S rRNA processing protein RimM [Candidatus Dependentiae bacterium]|nr:16S rRNA processing protein RimM [Candidatus Dependentiae bacterium]